MRAHLARIDPNPSFRFGRYPHPRRMHRRRHRRCDGVYIMADKTTTVSATPALAIGERTPPGKNNDLETRRIREIEIVTSPLLAKTRSASHGRDFDA